MQKITYLLFAATLLGACSTKEADPQPTPAPALRADVTRTLTYPADANLNAGLTYTHKTLLVGGGLDANALRLSFDAPEGTDAVGFTVPAARLAANLLGTYPIRNRQGSTGTAEAAYTYKLVNVATASSFRLYSSQTQDMSGQVVITAYDPARRLLSGTFTLTMDNVSDPRDKTALSSAPRCNVGVTGSFDNLPLQ